MGDRSNFPRVSDKDRNGSHVDHIVPASGIPFDHRLEDQFLALLARSGRVSHCAAAVGVTSAAVKARMASDLDFRSRYQEAVGVYRDRLLKEADRRATRGTLKPVFYKGQECGKVRDYSDRLLELLLKKHDPEIRERTENLNANVDMGMASVENLTPRQRDLLRKLLDEPPAV